MAIQSGDKVFYYMTRENLCFLTLTEGMNTKHERQNENEIDWLLCTVVQISIFSLTIFCVCVCLLCNETNKK